MFLRCGEQGRRRYIEGEIIPPGVAAGRGTGVHKANEVNLREKVKTSKDMSLGDLHDVARDGYVNSFRNGVYIPRSRLSEKKKLLNQGLNDTIRCTTIYKQKAAPLIHPVDVESQFEITVEGIDLPLAGRMDYQDEPTVGDLKTSSKTWHKDRIRDEIQVPFYSFVHEHERGIRPKFVYHVLIARRNKVGEPTGEDYQPLEHTCSDKDYNALFAKITMFMKMLKAEVFPPANPTAWWCNREYCGFFDT